MANIYERFLSTIIPEGKKPGLVRSPKSNPVGQGKTWMVDRLEIPRIVDSFLLAFSFFLHDEISLAVSKDELCFVKQRENQIVVTVGALLHYMHVEL